MSPFQTLICTLAGTIIASPFTIAACRVVNNTLDDGGDEGADPNGTADSQVQFCGWFRFPCEEPTALFVEPPHSPSVSGKAIQDHVQQ